LEELNLEFRFDINTHLDYNSMTMIEPVETIIKYQLEYIYFLCIFSCKTSDVISLMVYISIAEKFIPYIQYFSNSKLLNLLENILLFKIKILVENCDYLLAYENIKSLFKICFRNLHLYMDTNSYITYTSFKQTNDKNKRISYIHKSYRWRRILFDRL
jgi:hypothetical protein